MRLTPVGERTLEGFRKVYGDKAEAKFADAIKSGILDQTTMHADPLFGGSDQGTVTTREPAPAEKTEPTPVPNGMARTAGGQFQVRPG